MRRRGNSSPTATTCGSPRVIRSAGDGRPRSWAASPVIVNVSSGMGSLAAVHDPDRLEFGFVQVPYTSSKAAVNMITTQYAKAFTEMRINAVDPGYTSTDFNEHRGTQTVEEGAGIIVRMAELDRSGPSGAFVDARGTADW
jgi:NAD(P)-dependent dehydrogenase (short-subunit alcohol dehydrogenase family)